MARGKAASRVLDDLHRAAGARTSVLLAAVALAGFEMMDRAARTRITKTQSRKIMPILKLNPDTLPSTMMRPMAKWRLDGLLRTLAKH